MKKFENIITILGLVTAGVAMTSGFYLLGVDVCIVLVYNLNNYLINSIAGLYVKSSLVWILINQGFCMFLYYYFLKWAGSGKTHISKNMRIVLIIVVYLMSVILVTLSVNHHKL